MAKQSKKDKDPVILAGLSTTRRHKVINDIPSGSLIIKSTTLKVDDGEGNLKKIDDPKEMLEIIQTKYDELYQKLTPTQLNERDAEAAVQIQRNSLSVITAYGGDLEVLCDLAATMVEKFVLSRLPMVPDKFEINGKSYVLSTEKVTLYLSDVSSTIDISDSAGITLTKGNSQTYLERYRTCGYMPLNEEDLETEIDKCVRVHSLESKVMYHADGSLLHLSIYSGLKEVIRIVSQEELSVPNSSSIEKRKRSNSLDKLLNTGTNSKSNSYVQLDGKAKEPSQSKIGLKTPTEGADTSSAGKKD